MIEQVQTYHFALLSLPKIHTDLLWVLTIGFGALGLIYIIFVFFFRNRLSKKAARVAEKKRELAPIISHFLFHEKDASASETKEYLNQKVEVREMIKTRFNRSVLAEILMDLQKDVSGEARQNLYDLYVGLGLHHDAYTKLNSWRWEVVSQGILELTQMRVEDSYVFIRRFINHSKGVIRKQAQIATVSLRHEGISYFMDTCRYRISEWQQLKLIDVLRHFEDFTPPRFKVWLTSKNNDIVLFALRLIRYFSQNDANQAIIQLIKHKNIQIRSEAIQCLKEFGVTESLDTLKAAFRRSNTEIKLSILDAIGALGSKADVEFLKKVERTEDNFTVKSKALTAINTIDPNSIMPNDDIREPSKSDLAFARTDEHQVEANHQTKLDFELMIPEDEDPHIELHPPEVEEEDEDIFELCCKEELDDILEEAKQEEEPDYLALDFLPLVKDHKPEPADAPDPESEKEHSEESIHTEEKFRQDLDHILNKIAMKNDQNQTENHDELPEFLPKVVATGNDPEADLESEEFLKEMEVISEMIYGKEEIFEPESVEEAMSEIPARDNILETEVIAEELKAPKRIEDTAEAVEESVEEEISDEDGSEYDGFSIFHEMFRDFDAESKLILLDELLVVGEEKELHLLRSLSTDPDRRIRKKAARISRLLEEKLNSPQIEEEHMVQATESSDALLENPSGELEEMVPVLTEEEPEADTREGTVSQKLPLEYCFYDSIEELDAESLEPQFEVDQDTVDTPDTALAEDNAEDEVSDEKFISFLENLLSLKLKQRPKKNG